ncbi:MAG: hypothetical protein ABI743_06270 [bacterium]
MTRPLLAFSFLALAVILALIGFNWPDDSRVPDILLNLSAEMTGIAATLAIVDRILERSEQSTRLTHLATKTLGELDHAVWLWQGGAVPVSLTELRALLHHVADEDAMAPFTRGQFALIGVRAERALQNEHGLHALRPNGPLRTSFDRLAQLTILRDDRGGMLKPLEIARLIEEALPGLATAARRTLPEAAGLSSESLGRDPSLAAQRARHMGHLEVYGSHSPLASET